MKQRAFAWMLALILALTPILAIADGEQTEPPATQAPVEPTEQPTAAPTQTPGEPTETPQAAAVP